jgi:hypothetical protein
MNKLGNLFIAQYLEQKVIDQHVLWGERYKTILQCKVIDQHGVTWYVKERYTAIVERTTNGHLVENRSPNFFYDWQEA